MSNYETHKLDRIATLEALLAGFEPEDFSADVAEGLVLRDAPMKLGNAPQGVGRTVLLGTIEALQQTESVEDLRALVAYTQRSDFHSPIGGDNSDVNRKVASFIQLVASHIEISFAGDPQAAAFQEHQVSREAGASAAVSGLLKKLSRPTGPN